jgi:hypothetical protein
MGIIEDIADIVPKVQKRIAESGIDMRDAIVIEIKEMGYIPKKEGGFKFEAGKRTKGDGNSGESKA